MFTANQIRAMKDTHFVGRKRKFGVTYVEGKDYMQGGYIIFDREGSRCIVQSLKNVLAKLERAGLGEF